MNPYPEKYAGAAVTFTVIIPAYDVEPYLARCLDSVIPALSRQDEIILSLEMPAEKSAEGDAAAGGRKDRSEEIALDYARRYENIKSIYHDIRGLSNARNYALRKARGTYIVYIDGDDRVDTELFTKALQDIREDEALTDLYVYDFYCDNCLTGRLEPHFQIGEGGDFEGIENIHRMLKARADFWNAWRFIYRRQFLGDNAITFPENRLCEDIDHTTSVLLAGPKAVFRHTPFYIYTQHRGGSIMNSISLQRLEDVVYILKRSIQRLRSSGLSYNACVIAQYQFEYILNLALIYELPKDKREAGRRLFTDADKVLEGSDDRVVRLIQHIVKVSGVTPVGYALHVIKRLRHSRMSGSPQNCGAHKKVKK